MSVASAHVDLFRDHWADRMVDTCTIRRLTDRGTINPTTLEYDAETWTVIYTGPCLIRPVSGSLGEPKTVKAGEEQKITNHLHLFLPHTADTIKPDDHATIDTSTDSRLVGAVPVVVAADSDTYITRRRVTARLWEGSGGVDA